jgi:4-hydroxyproline epimerase
MQKTRFFCIDAHTCGNPVRVVAGGGPQLSGDTMMEKRAHFLREYDWVRKSLMFEPRGHDMMSGSILYPPCDPTNDVGVLFIETSGCLPMCGHGTIGTITIAIEEGLIHPKVPGLVKMETPAGLVIVTYHQDDFGKVKTVKLVNVPSFLYKSGLETFVKDLGVLKVDVAYGGNFYAIVDPQDNYKGLEYFTTDKLIAWGREMRTHLNENYTFQHPLLPAINVCSHVQWTTDKTIHPESTSRNAVFYGDKAIDRSPCGTGTSARLAQWHALGKIQDDDVFKHESYIGSVFNGTIEGRSKVGEYDAVIPGIEGWARIYGYNTILVDPSDDPFAAGFQVI